MDKHMMAMDAENLRNMEKVGVDKIKIESEVKQLGFHWWSRRPGSWQATQIVWTRRRRLDFNKLEHKSLLTMIDPFTSIWCVWTEQFAIFMIILVLWWMLGMINFCFWTWFMSFAYVCAFICRYLYLQCLLLFWNKEGAPKLQLMNGGHTVTLRPQRKLKLQPNPHKVQIAP